MNTKERVSRFIRNLDTKSAIIFGLVATSIFIGVNFFDQYVSQVVNIILIIEIAFVILVAWSMAMHAVVKSLFAVGAGLSLLIFLAQSYCEVPSTARMADDALRSLLLFGFIYIGIEFCLHLYREARKRSLEFKETNNNNKGIWLVIVPFAIFTGLVVWQVVQILIPIIGNLCIYSWW